jgi:dynein assembly factor 2
MESIAEAELDASDARLFLRVAGKYELDLRLPFDVFGDDGKATFDKKTKTLEVALPVRPAPREPALRFAEPSDPIDPIDPREPPDPPDPPDPFFESEAGKVLENVSETVSENPESVTTPSTPSVRDASLALPLSDASSLFPRPDDAEARAAASAAAAAAAAAAFEARGETENQRLWREMYGSKDDGKEVNGGDAGAPNAGSSTRSDPNETRAEGGFSGDEAEEDSKDSKDSKDVPQREEPVQAPNAPTATYLRPSLRGAAEFADALD